MRATTERAAHKVFMTTIDAQGAIHAGDGKYTHKNNSAAPDGLLSNFVAARDAQREARAATMEAAQEALPAVVFANDPDIVEVSFAWGEHGLYALDARTIDGDAFLVTSNARLHNEIWDLFLAMNDYEWVRYNSDFTTDDNGETFKLSIPGNDPVGRHIARQADEAGWGIAKDVFGILQDRERFEDDDFLAIDSTLVTELIEGEFMESIDNLNYELVNNDGDEPIIDPTRADEVHAHLANISKAAYLGSMETFLGVVYDREEVSDDDLLELTSGDVTSLYEDHIAPGIDRVERALRHRLDAGSLV